MIAPAKTRKRFYETLSVDVDIDASILEENGYHHENDCPATPSDVNELDDGERNRQALSDWHDKAHGLTHWVMCHDEPCNQLTLDYRGMP